MRCGRRCPGSVSTSSSYASPSPACARATSSSSSVRVVGPPPTFYTGRSGRVPSGHVLVTGTGHGLADGSSPRARSSSRPRIRPPSTRRPLCSYSFVSQACSAADRGGGLLGELALDVHVLGVDRGRGRHLVRAQPLRRRRAAASRRPRRAGRAASRSGRSTPYVLEHPRVDHLAGEERLVLELGKLGEHRARADQRVGPPSEYSASWRSA